MSEYSEKLKGLGFLSKRGQTQKKRVVRDDNGKTAGYHIEHWSGRQDAVVTPDTVKIKIKQETPDVS